VDLLQIIFLALIQGITEFLPVSSSAHLIIPNQLWNWQDQGLAFDIAVHAGSLFAVLLYFREDIRAFAVGGFGFLSSGKVDEPTGLLFKIIAASLPLVFAGLILKDFVATELRYTWVIASASIFFGIVLWLADRSTGSTKLVDMAWKAALIIGFAQILALIPGTSRSGITITAALFLNLSPEAAARFSFLLSIPAILGASTLAIIELWQSELVVNWGDLLTGALISAVAAYLCIHFFISLLKRTGMTPYVIYRIALGIFLFGLIWVRQI
jgi:undecaprenyl-diphosphatase